eukprot:3820849-Rhodomonas_salina.1
MEVTTSFRALRTRERWNPPPPEVALSRFFAKHPAPATHPMRQKLTEKKLNEIREGMQKRNPAQTGFSVDRKETIVCRFDDLQNVCNVKELAAMMVSDGFEFPAHKEPEEFIIFIGEEGLTVSKATFTVMRNQRVYDLIAGDKPFYLENYPVSARVYTSGAVKKGRVLKIEGALCSWVKKMALLGIPLQKCLWQIAHSLMYAG